MSLTVSKSTEISMANISETRWDSTAAGSQLDALYLRLLELMEKHAEQRLELEAQISRGRMLLARSRLQDGVQRTATAADEALKGPLRALCRLVQQALPDCLAGTAWKLLRKPLANAERGQVGHVTQLFGVLVPLSLRVASKKFERCVEQLVECANLQRELDAVLAAIERLRRAMNWHKKKYPLD